MQNGFRFGTARDLFRAYPSASADIRALPSEEPPLIFCRTLASSRTPEEAISFCGYYLPERVCVWWGHECLRNLSNLLEEQDVYMLSLVYGWVNDPSTYRRHDMLERALKAASRTPGVWIALAGGWSTEGHHRHVLPDPRFLTSRAVNTGILAALARVALSDRGPVLTDLVDMGVQLAQAEAGHYA